MGQTFAWDYLMQQNFKIFEIDLCGVFSNWQLKMGVNCAHSNKCRKTSPNISIWSVMEYLKANKVSYEFE